MRHISVISPLIIAITILSGCASLSKEECLGGDWERIGYADGAAGKSASYIDDHKKACNDYSIAPDIAAYRIGRAAGLEQVYCKPHNAYRIGLTGYSYNNVCPSYLRADFLVAYHDGKEILRLQKQAKGLHSKLQHIDTDTQQLGHKISQLNYRIHSYHSDRSSPRKKIRLHIKDERDQHNAIMKKKKQGLIKKLRLKNEQIDAFREYMTLAREKGRYQNRLNWENESGFYPKPGHDHRKRYRRRLDDLDRQINRQQKILGVSRLSHEHRQKVVRLMQIVEYSSELDSQLRTLQRLDTPSEVKQLIRFHYAHEPEYIAKHSDRYLLHGKPKKSLHALRSELRHAILEQDRLLLERKDVMYELSTLEQNILHMKTTSVYH